MNTRKHMEDKKTLIHERCSSSLLDESTELFVHCPRREKKKATFPVKAVSLFPLFLARGREESPLRR